MNSIISDEYKCFVCKTPFNLHKHHIYGGYGRRGLSEKYGCWCYLCARHHNMSECGVHRDSVLNLKLRRLCQEKLEQSGWTREQFIKTFGRSYIDALCDGDDPDEVAEPE